VVLASCEDSVSASLGPFIGLRVTDIVDGAAGVESVLRDGNGVEGLGRMYSFYQYTIARAMID